MEEEDKVNLYQVKVVVEYYYEVEATSDKEAEEEGWNYEDYRHCGEVYSINIDLIEEDIHGEKEEEDTEGGEQ
jgi:hypothetical protein